jgi:hypothetical protein
MRDDDAPSAQTLPTPRPEGRHDIYVDNSMLMFVKKPANRQQAPFAIVTAADTITRPNNVNEPITREPIISANKLAAEGSPS